MPNVRNYKRAFSGGELSPEMGGHLEATQHQTGCGLVRNFITKTTGPAFNRPGTRFVREVKNSAKRTRLIDFSFSVDDTLRIELGEGYFRFIDNGVYLTVSPPAFVTSKQIASVSTVADSFDTTVNHLFTTGDEVRLDFAPGALMPGGVSLFQTYFAIVVDPNTFQIATTLQNALDGLAINLTGAPTGTFYVHRVYRIGALSSYVGNPYYATEDSITDTTPTPAAAAAGTLAAATDLVTAVAHGLFHGTAISFAKNGGTLPPEIIEGATYYAQPISANTFAISSKRDPVSMQDTFDDTDCIVGTPFLTIATEGILTGDVVVFSNTGGALPAPLAAGTPYFVLFASSSTLYVSATRGGSAVIITAAASGGVHTMRHFGSVIDLTANSTGSPTWQRVSSWYQMPADGTFELPNDYLESELFEIDSFQSNDVVTLCHRAHDAMELRRLGTTNWQLRPILYSVSDLPAPTIQEARASTDAQGLRIFAVTAATPAVLATGSGGGALVTNHGLQIGNQVLLTSPIGTVGSAAGSIPNGTYIVHSTPNPWDVTLRNVQTGTVVGSGSAVITGSPTLYVTTPGDQLTHRYRVTTVDRDGRESEPSPILSIDNYLGIIGGFNVINWTAVPGALHYRVYREHLGLFALIGKVDEAGALTTGFFDRDEAVPDLGQTLPKVDDELTTSEGGPATGCYFEGRRFFGGPPEHPNRVYGTRSGTESDLTYHDIVQPSDRLQFDVSSRNQNALRHLVPMAQLLALTTGAEYRVSPVNTDALEPGSIAPRPQTYVGSSPVRPLIVNNSVLFVGDSDGHVYELGFSAEAGSFRAGDASVRAAHLFDRYDIVDSAFMRAPIPIAWFVSSSGALLGFTYSPEEGVGGWHVHETDGAFESVSCAREGTEDVVYVVVCRTINGSTKRYVERLEALLRPAAMADMYFVDCGITTTTPGGTITGLSHLEGKTVAVLVDGVKQTNKVVSGGQISVSPAVVAKAHVGLPYVARLRPLAPALPADDFGASRTKAANHAYVDVVDSCQFTVGPTETSQHPTIELSSTAYATRRCRVPLPLGWQDAGIIEIRQADPLPLTVVSLSLELAVGG